MLKNKNKKYDCKFCELDDLTKERLTDIARFLKHSEVDVIKILIDQYYKMQTIKDENENSYSSIEFIPFYETAESYKELKADYEKEYRSEYPAIIMSRDNY